MKITVEKSGATQEIKERYLQNFLDRGWKKVSAKKTKPAVKIEAAAEVKPVVDEPQAWDINEEEWAESQEAMMDNKGE